MKDLNELNVTGRVDFDNASKCRDRGFEVVPDKYRKHTDVEIQLPRRADGGACASDIYSPIDITIMPNEQVLIWTDVCVFMNTNEVLLLNVRSSMGKPRIQLANTQGWVDSTYYSNPDNFGNIGLNLRNEGAEPYVIKKGDRIAQGMFTFYLAPCNDNPIHEERLGGFGSSNR